MGQYPQELVLLEANISLHDQETLGTKKCRLYYEYIMAKMRVQNKHMKEKMEEGKGHSGVKKVHMEAPDNFMNELEVKIAERELELKNESKR